MSESARSIFLSYASEDADAAKRIAEALRDTGIEAWLDQSELRGGDAWDASIRARIRDCALFVPIILANTEARGEGYFRLEWKLAVDRLHQMADDQPFLLPVVIDATPEPTARVPDAFRSRQWTRLPGGRDAGAFAARARGLLEAPRRAETHAASSAPPVASRKTGSRVGLAVGIAALAFVAFVVYQPFSTDPRPKRSAGPAPATETKRAGPQTVAVMPFANLSDDKANEYFSDGVSEELLTVLQQVPGLQVVARSSSFALKGQQVTAQEVARKLGVDHLVEGSVRKAGKSVRIAARLVRATTGQQIWSDAYTRELDDVFAVQSALAQTIVERLRAHLEGGLTEAAKAEVQSQVQSAARGGTSNAEAHQLYLQGLFYLNQFSRPTVIRAQGFLERAVAIDPRFALAWAALARTGAQLGGYSETRREFDDGWSLSKRAAEKALALEPDLAGVHVARARMQMWHDYDWKGAAESLRRARSAAPADPDLAASSAMLSYAFGRKDEAVERAREAVARDPLNAETQGMLGWALEVAGKAEEAQATLRRIAEINPAAPWGHAGVGWSLLNQGRHDEALKEARKESTEWSRLTIEAMALWGLGKRAESSDALARLKQGFADVAALQIAQVHAYRGENDRAFEWLERAYRQRDSGLAWAKPDPAFARLKGDPRWPAFLKKLGVGDD